MKLCTYRVTTPLGVWHRSAIFQQDLLVDLNFTMQAYLDQKGYCNSERIAQSRMPASLFEFLQTSPSALEELKEVESFYTDLIKMGTLKTKNGNPIALHLKDHSELGLACPLDKVGVYRDFYTHEKHVKKGFEKRGEPVPPEWYEMPVFYKGAPYGFIGPEEEVLWPEYSNKLDYELELAAIVSKSGRSVKASAAKDHILGFTILNDISARDIQKKEMKVRLGPSKGKDFCSVLGPVITTIDELGDNPDLTMTATINGELWSKGQSGDSQFSFPEMLEFAAKNEEIHPGDVLGSGTVGTGCGLEIDKWIQPGDTITLEVEGIGKLTNPIGEKQ